jgi:diguanylate cyclase (GGDEF)-like protein
MPKRVLMIDDALPLHRIVESRLRGDDIELHSAVDGTTGLEIAAHLRPNVILLDVDLPDLDGFEVCRRLKANGATADIPVIFLTAEGGTANRQHGLDLGAFAFVTKPFRSDELTAAVTASIRSRWQTEQDAGVDAITGLWTRAHLKRHLADNTAAAKGGSIGPTSCIIADVDDMRLINARHGTTAGDEVLRSVGQLFVNECRNQQAVCSAGGGKFAIVLSGVDRLGARRFAERLRDAVRAHPVHAKGGAIEVTCSFGVADTVVADDSRLIGRAEAALVRAKRGGSARVSVARLPRRSLAAAA